MNNPEQTVTTKGIIIKSEVTGEKSKLLTVLTSDLGTLRILATGGNNPKASYFRSVQLFSYSLLTLKTTGAGYILSEAEHIESFYMIRQDILSFALACYFAEISSRISVPNDEGPLRVLLNCLFAITRKVTSNEKIKAVFELKTAMAAGFYPSLDSCVGCGTQNSDAIFLSITDGGILCGECAEKAQNEGTELIQISRTVYDTLTFLRDVDPKRMFGFELDREGLDSLCELSEKYLLYYLEIEAPTLDFYKRMKEQ